MSVPFTADPTQSNTPPIVRTLSSPPPSPDQPRQADHGQTQRARFGDVKRKAGQARLGPSSWRTGERDLDVVRPCPNVEVGVISIASIDGEVAGVGRRTAIINGDYLIYGPVAMAAEDHQPERIVRCAIDGDAERVVSCIAIAVTVFSTTPCL